MTVGKPVEVGVADTNFGVVSHVLINRPPVRKFVTQRLTLRPPYLGTVGQADFRALTTEKPEQSHHLVIYRLLEDRFGNLKTSVSLEVGGLDRYRTALFAGCDGRSWPLLRVAVLIEQACRQRLNDLLPPARTRDEPTPGADQRRALLLQ
jgi:hypothetical protein